MKLNNKGFALTLILAFVFILIMIVINFIILANNEIIFTRQQDSSLDAFFIAEAAVEKTLFELSKDNDYSGETDVPLGNGVYDVTVTSVTDEKKINAIGYVPDKASSQAVREIRVTAAKPINPITVTSAITVLTDDAEITVKGNCTIDGGTIAGISISDSNNISIGGSGEVLGSPPIEEGAPPTFEEVFGLTEEQMKSLATVYTNPNPNNPNPSNGVTWIEGGAQFTKSSWSGQGIIIVNGNLKLTGGRFDGIIYVMGSTDVSAGNADLNGALFTTGDAKFAGTSDIDYDETAINNAGTYYPYEISFWEEI